MTSSSSDPPVSDSGLSPGDASTVAADDAVFHPVSRRRAAIWSMVFYYPSLALILVRNIALVPLYFKYIGQVEFDAWLVTGAMLMQLTNVDLGLTGVLSQQVAAAYGSRSRNELQKLLGTGLVLAAGVSVLMGCVTAAISPLIPLLFDMPPEVGHRVSVCFLIVAISTAIQLFGFATGGLLRSFQRAFFYGFFALISEIVSLIATIYLLKAGYGLYSIGLGLVIRAGVEVFGTGLTLLWVSLARLKLRFQWDWPHVRQLWGFSIYQFLTQLTGRIKSAMDGMFIGMFISTKAGGDYTLTVRAHDTVRFFSGGFTGALSQPLAHLHGEGDVPRYKEVISLLFRVTLFVGAIGYGGVIALNHEFMLLWVGPNVYSGALINMMAALAGIAYALIVVPYEALYTRAGFSAITRVVWIEVIVRSVMMIALLRTIGVLGTPVTNVLCQVFGLFLPLAWINVRDLGFTRSDIGSLVGSLLKLLAGPLILAAAFSFVMRTEPVPCAFTVSRGYVNRVVEQVKESFPPGTGLHIDHEPTSSKFVSTGTPKVQERLGVYLTTIDMAIAATDFLASPNPRPGFKAGVIESTFAPANAWFVLAGQASLFVLLCLIYTWMVDSRLLKFLLRGGRGTA